MVKILKTFYAFLLKKWPTFIGFVLLVILSNIFFALNPVFYKKFVDTIPSLNESALFEILALYMLVRVLAVIFDMAAFWVGDVVSFHAGVDARIKIFKKVQDLDFAFHSQKSTGSLISAFKRGDGAFFSFFHDIHHKMLGVLINFSVMLYFFSSLDAYILLMVVGSLIATLAAAKFLIANNVNKRKFF